MGANIGRIDWTSMLNAHASQGRARYKLHRGSAICCKRV